MNTPSDDVALWLADATGPVQYVVGVFGLCMFVMVGVALVRRAVRGM